MAKQTTTPEADSEGTARQVERQIFIQLVQSAMRKHAAKEQLTPREARAWAKWEVEEDERRGKRWLANMPKKTYCSIVGRQPKVLNDQADAYGVPLRGHLVDAAAVLRWLHDFFAKHRLELPAIVRGELATGTPRDKLIQEQTEVFRRRVRILEAQIELNEQTLLPRADVHELLVKLSRVLRGAGERLHKQFGPQAASILDVALNDYDSLLAGLVEDSKPKQKIEE